jgi:hypothetical protein
MKNTCLIIFMMIAVCICLPVAAEEQSGSHVYLSMRSQDTSDNSLEKGGGHKFFLKTSEVTPSEAHSSYVGTRWSFKGWYTPLTVGKTIIFQRSTDGINWCTFHTGVTGADGYAYLNDYTETCPGTVYYRSAEVNGLGSANVFEIDWLPTNPETTCVPIPKCIQKTFSMTCIENYDHICDKDGKNCIIRDTFKECDNIGSALRNRGYRQNFYLKDDEVIPENFVTDPSYAGHKLTDSAFHYHSGHGADGSKTPVFGGLTSATYLQLKKWWIVNPFAHTVSAGNVENKWGGENKWVMLDSCNLLKDKNWGNALTTSHGILGYSTDSWVRQDFGDMFFGYAIDQKKTIVDAYKMTTIEIYHSDESTATVIARNATQIKMDQFPGIEGGHMEPDGDLASNQRYRYNWNCRKDGADWWD